MFVKTNVVLEVLTLVPALQLSFLM